MSKKYRILIAIGMVITILLLYVFSLIRKGITFSNYYVINEVSKTIELYNDNNLEEAFERINVTAIYNNIKDSATEDIGTYEEFRKKSYENFINNKKYLDENKIAVMRFEFVSISPSIFYDWDVNYDLVVKQDGKEYDMSIKLMYGETGVLTHSIGTEFDINEDLVRTVMDYYLSP